ncbi:MAG TPA: transposase [Vicinamibacterales bacterium]|nr:transposase [Vicinamibacterales bacterium]
MCRNSRNLPAGCVVHCVNRGNDRRLLFERAAEYEDFLRLVAWAKGQCPVRIIAYCIMSNHWHFVFWVRLEWDVSAFLHRLTTTHAVKWRTRTDTIGNGSVYQGRFKSSEVLSERYYYNLLRYVEQNPLRANLVRSSNDWRWSSLAERTGNGRSILNAGPLALLPDWRLHIDQPVPRRTVDEIRRSLKKY